MRRIAAACATSAILVGLSVWLVDRPFASWSHAHLGDRGFDWFRASYDGHVLPIGPFSLMAALAQAQEPLAILILVILALAAASGLPPRRRGRIALTASLAVLAAGPANGLAKAGFGRTWPESWLGDNPSWIRDGAFGFHPLHGGLAYGSFPSGHAAVITAPATVLWVIWPELRLLWAACIAVVAAGLLGADYHFVSDIVGGITLGAAVGQGMILLLLPCAARLSRPTETGRAPPRAPPLRHDPGA